MDQENISMEDALPQVTPDPIVSQNLSNLTQQQSPPPQFPPANPTQSTDYVSPPKKAFPTKKLIIGITVVLIIIGLATTGLFLYQKSTNKDSPQNKSTVQTQASPTSAVENNPSQQITSSPTGTLSTNKSWDECKVFANESDYTNVDGRDIGQYLPITLTKFRHDPFDAAKWQESKNQILSSIGKDVNGSIILNAHTKPFFGYEAIVFLAKSQNAATGKEEVSGDLISPIMSHSMYLNMYFPSEGDMLKDAEAMYTKTFKYLCH